MRPVKGITLSKQLKLNTKCSICHQIVPSKNDSQIMFIHQSCKKQMCYWCLLQNYLQNYQVKSVYNHSTYCHESLKIQKYLTFMNCCQKNISYLYLQMEKYIKETCPIDGKKCSSKSQYQCNNFIKIGKQCLDQLIQKKLKSFYQNKIIQNIKKYIKGKCVGCDKYQVDLITEKQQNLLTCNQCLQQNIKNQLRNQILNQKNQQIQENKLGKLHQQQQQTKECFFCKSIQSMILQRTQKSPIRKDIMEVKQIQLYKDQDNYYCYSCLYLKWKKIQDQGTKLKINSIKLNQEKNKYQLIFQYSCLVCGFEPQLDNNIFMFNDITNSQVNSINVFICSCCHEQLFYQGKQYKSVKILKKYLKDTQQNNVKMFQLINVQKFRKNAQGKILATYQGQQISKQLKQHKQQPNNIYLKKYSSMNSGSQNKNSDTQSYERFLVEARQNLRKNSQLKKMSQKQIEIIKAQQDKIKQLNNRQQSYWNRTYQNNKQQNSRISNGLLGDNYNKNNDIHDKNNINHDKNNINHSSNHDKKEDNKDKHHDSHEKNENNNDKYKQNKVFQTKQSQNLYKKQDYNQKYQYKEVNNIEDQLQQIIKQVIQNLNNQQLQLNIDKLLLTIYNEDKLIGEDIDYTDDNDNSDDDDNQNDNNDDIIKNNNQNKSGNQNNKHNRHNNNKFTKPQKNKQLIFKQENQQLLLKQNTQSQQQQYQQLNQKNQKIKNTQQQSLQLISILNKSEAKHQIVCFNHSNSKLICQKQHCKHQQSFLMLGIYCNRCFLEYLTGIEVIQQEGRVKYQKRQQLYSDLIKSINSWDGCDSSGNDDEDHKE